MLILVEKSYKTPGKIRDLRHCSSNKLTTAPMACYLHCYMGMLGSRYTLIAFAYPENNFCVFRLNMNNKLRERNVSSCV